jgi:hypothetical protein
MKFCGNYKHIIKPEWIDALLNSKGTLITPFHDYVEDPIQAKKLLEDRYIPERVNATDDIFINGAYGSNLIMAEMYTKDNLPFEIDLGELNQFLVGDWWIIKQLPGQFMPVHKDTANPVDDNHRFWFPWTDYTPGHVFIHEGKFVGNYKAGDLWQYNNDDDLHGSANISTTPRIIMQISENIIK